MKIVVVTASIGERRLRLLTPEIVNPAVEYVCFTDKPAAHPVWRTIKVERLADDPVRDAKRYKVLAADILRAAGIEAEASIWCDRHCRLCCDPVEAFERFPADVALIRHYRRCIYKEGRACRKKKKDDIGVINAEMDMRRLEGWRPNAGLYYGGFVMRRHTAASERFSRLWWSYIESGSRRDQLSLPVALRRSGVSKSVIARAELRSFFHVRSK